MSNEEHHRFTLIETARTELDRAHRGALAMEAGEVRRGLQLALAAMQEAAATDAPADPALAASTAKLSAALSELDGGSLARMDTLIEELRVALA